MVAINSHPADFTPDEIVPASPSPPLTTGTNTPRHEQSPSKQMAEAQARRQQRHSKKLSINFPILLPPRGNDTPSSPYTASPTALSPHPMTHGTFFSPPSMHASHCAVPSSVTLPMPLTPPSEEDQLHAIGRARSKSRGHVRQESTSAEFLTLLASQERKVLELKEEVSRAEAELTALKKQWAFYEAGKKKTESKGAPAKMGPVVPSHTRAMSVAETTTGLGLSGADELLEDDKLEVEREKRREIARERMMGRVPNTGNGQPANGNAKKGQRVFKNSRHTRTLSLLTASTTGRNEQGETPDSTSDGKPSLDSTRQPSIDTPPTTATPSMPSLSRTNSGLDALTFGKTYKDLASAASRKNLPPGLSPEQFVKHGKQVVDGVRDGLWNFFEDIRQATVGEEAINGVGAGVRRQNSTKIPDADGNTKIKRSPTDASERPKKGSKEHDSSFWKEFGMDTPKSDKSKRNSNISDQGKRPSLPGRWPSTKVGDDFQTSAGHKHHNNGHVRKPSDPRRRRDSGSAGAEHHKSKSSTDSRNPPSLVADDHHDDEDDNWDTWDSTTEPGSPRVERKRTSPQSMAAAARRDGKRMSDEGKGREVQWHDLVS